MNASIAQVATQDLIPVFQANIDGVLVNACDARLLHAFLEVTTKFSDWIVRRIKHYGFVENSDFITVLKNGNGENRGFQPIDYHLRLDMGKELSMIEKNEKGRQARKYFINCERLVIEALTKPQNGLKSLPPSPYISEAEALQLSKSIGTHCKTTGTANFAELYDKIYRYFGITSYKHIPAGKLPEAARLAGITLVEVKKPTLPPEPQLLTFTPAELDQRIDDAIRSVRYFDHRLSGSRHPSNDISLMVDRALGILHVLSVQFENNEVSTSNRFIYSAIDAVACEIKDIQEIANKIADIFHAQN
jgi:phage anti-repressor protein